MEEETGPEPHTRSERSNKGVPPDQDVATHMVINTDSEPRNATEHTEFNKNWKRAMDEEIASLKGKRHVGIVPRPNTGISLRVNEFSN